MTEQAANFNTNSGSRLMNAGDLDGALAQFESAIKADSSYALAHQQLSIALERKGDKARAAKESEIARSLSQK
jgi:Tfp pilus assembly protein PilF